MLNYLLTLMIFPLIFAYSEKAKAFPVPENTPQNRIQPYSKNPMYWQYIGKPIMLIRSSDTDNPLQLHYIETHLDDLVASGGNYIRNIMAWSRTEDVLPYLQNEIRLFDLNQQNPEFFHRLENLLRMAYYRDIIVQIEIWESWNYYMKGGEGYPKRGWGLNPFNPVNNVNYKLEESGMPKQIDFSKRQYPGEHTYFYTLPEELDLPVVIKYQEAFVDQILDVTLGYPNVLYCMNNQTKEAHSWVKVRFVFHTNVAPSESVEFCLNGKLDAGIYIAIFNTSEGFRNSKLIVY